MSARGVRRYGVRSSACAFVLLAVVQAGAGRARVPAQGQTPQPAPTMKGRTKPVMPRARAQRWYDRERDVTYVNVDIVLDSPGAQPSATPAGQKGETKAGRKGAAPQVAPPRELALVFQLIFKGRATADLASAYLIVQATAGCDERPRLDALAQIEIDAEGYQYQYARTDYQTELIEAQGAQGQGPLPLKREAAAFPLSPEDLPQMANVNSLKLKLGPERFTVKSPQLTELRRTLVTGGDD
jgi:hypothetical protein